MALPKNKKVSEYNQDELNEYCQMLFDKSGKPATRGPCKNWSGETSRFFKQDLINIKDRIGDNQEDIEALKDLQKPITVKVSDKKAEAELATLLSNHEGRKYMEKAIAEGNEENALEALKNIEVIGQYFDEALEKFNDEGIELNEEQKVGLAELIRVADAPVKEVNLQGDGSIEIVFEKNSGTYEIFKSFEEAEKRAVESVVNLLDDCGLDHIREEDFIQFVSESGERAMEEALDEMDSEYMNDIEGEDASDSSFESRLEEEMAENNCETKEEFQAHLKNNRDRYITREWAFRFGKESLVEFVKRNDYFDTKAYAQYVVDTDGIALQIANYDHKEHELSGNMYAYRTN